MIMHKCPLYILLSLFLSNTYAFGEDTTMKKMDISFELELNVSVEEAWSLWTDSKKLEKWLTSEAIVNPELGGAYELFWDPTNHNDNSTIGCKITAFIPNRLLAFEWRGPVPFADLMNVDPFPTWASVSFEPRSIDQTVFHFRHSGWGEGERWKAARDWQIKAWNGAFGELKNLINKN